MVHEDKDLGDAVVDRETEQPALSIKVLVQRFESAVWHEAEGEYRDLSDTTLKRRGDAVTSARSALMGAIEKQTDAVKIAEAARDFVWEPENWEAYQDSKGSNSVAWPPEFLSLAQAVEAEFGPMPVDED